MRLPPRGHVYQFLEPGQAEAEPAVAAGTDDRVHRRLSKSR